MTTNINGLEVWTTSDPENLPLAISTLATSINSKYAPSVRNVADFDALPTTGNSAGDLAVVREGNVIMIHNGTIWQQNNVATFASSGDRTTAYAKASGAYLINGAKSRITGELWDRRYVSATTAWTPFSGTHFPIYPTSVSGSGSAITGSGKIIWTNGLAGSPLIVDGVFPTGDFTQFRLIIRGYSSAAFSLTMLLRTTAPADDGTTNYQHTEALFRNGTTASSTTAAVGTGWALPNVNESYAVDGVFHNVNVAQVTSFQVSVGSTEIPQVQGNNSLISNRFATHNGLTVMNGFKLTASGNFTGVLDIEVMGIL